MSANHLDAFTEGLAVLIGARAGGGGGEGGGGQPGAGGSQPGDGGGGGGGGGYRFVNGNPDSDGGDGDEYVGGGSLGTRGRLDLQTTTDAMVTAAMFNHTSISNDTHDSYEFYQTEQITFLCIMFAFIIIGNASVILAIMLSKNRKSQMNFFIMQLAIADLATGMVTVLTDILWKTTVEWHAGNVGCKLVRFMQSSATFASTYVLVAMSIDRLDAIARPMNFSGSGRRARALICVAWGMAALFSVPMLVLNKEMIVHHMKQCWIPMEQWQWRLYVTLLALLLFIIPAIIIGICYTVIVIIIWSKGSLDGSPKPQAKKRFISKNVNTTARWQRNGRVKMEATSCASSRGLIPKARIKTIKMTLVIVLVFICCWSPYFIFDLLDVYGHVPMSQKKIAVAVFIQSLAPLNSAANPVIYCLFSTRSCSNWRQIPLCEWLVRHLCCCCVVEPSYNTRGRHFTASMTEYSTVPEVDRRSGRTGSSRRHSNSPYVKQTLNNKEKEILLKHSSRNGRALTGSPNESDDTVTAV